MTDLGRKAFGEGIPVAAQTISEYGGTIIGPRAARSM
ncbi:hypothetical protein MELE44368_00755 [Mycolicibacterium elephantis DSM 44368]|uniref:Uncharacterized protein n=1 Tax=Mycolicibacterium elephantis DSM 44368 TaxID=1335622 RepID=A0A439E009_9MYCO|nr:hypothetical protein MELE44368_00755 [Mycolicibacterium elephantis DSM 44368]